MNDLHIASRFRRTSITTAILLASLGSAHSSFSQGMLEEVVVTAQKRAQGANDIGITMNAFSGETLQQLGVFTAEDMAQFTPGLTINDTAATGVPLYSIRGVGFQDYSTGASSTVGLYFDEIAMPYTVMSRGAVFDIARVEVLKGPQGDLYGRNTTAGQINFVSNAPTEEFEAGIRIGYGSYDVFDFEGFVSGGLSDSVQGRFAFRTTQSGEGWQDSLTRDDELGEKDVMAMRGLLNFDLSEDASLLLRAHYVQDESDNKAPTAYNGLDGGQDSVSNAHLPLQDFTDERGSNAVGSLTATPPWYSTRDNEAADWTNNYTSAITGESFDLRPARDNELKGISAKLEWNFGNFTLTSLTAYDEFEREEANDWDGGFFNDSSNINTTDLESFSQELRFSGETDDILWIAGLYYSQDDMEEFYKYFMSDSRFGNASIPFGLGPFILSPILQLDTKYEQETESRAIFGHIEYSFAENFRLTLGARYTEEERDWSGCTFSASDNSLGSFLNTLFGSTLQAGDCGTIDDDPNSPTYIFAMLGAGTPNEAFHVYEDSIDTEKWMGKIGLDYSLNDDVLLYASWSRGFKSGGFNGANSNTTLQLQPYTEEELDAFEVGAKSTLLDGSMQLNVSAFFYDYTDKQEQDPAITFVGAISGLTNVPKSEIYGAELDLQWLPVEGLMVTFGAAYLHTEITEWEATQAVDSWPEVLTFDASGLELPQAPEWSVNGLVSYQWPVSDTLYLEVAGDFNFKDSTTGGTQAEDATEDYTVYNARVTLGELGNKWDLQLWARNLTDEYYYPSAFRGGNGPYVRSVGMHRTYGVTLGYNFQ
jgi:iron complex outermembrane recepter protein